MLPEYPPGPRAPTGFDMMLVYASVEDEDWSRAARVVRHLRREALHRGAAQSAAKALWTLRPFLKPPHDLRCMRRVVAEAPGVKTYFWLRSAEERAGHPVEATAAVRSMLRVARRVGDLDGVAIARRQLEAKEMALGAESYSRRCAIACDPSRVGPAMAYAAGHRLKREALRSSGRATAIHCVLRLLNSAAHALDTRAGVRFARELVELETSSFSWLALALALERVGRVQGAGEEFARALRLARREGDLHRATKATAGLLRTGQVETVSPAALNWTLREASKEPEGPPDYRYLAASLGLRGIGEDP